MIYIFTKTSHSSRGGWGKPTTMRDQPHPTDPDIDSFEFTSLEFDKQCEVMAARRAEYEALCGRIDSKAKSWTGEFPQIDPDEPEIEATVAIQLTDLGSCVVGTIKSGLSDSFEYAIVLFPAARRDKFNPKGINDKVSGFVGDLAKPIIDKLMKCWWEEYRDGSVAFVIWTTLSSGDLCGVAAATEAKVIRAVARFALERDNSTQAPKSGTAAA